MEFSIEWLKPERKKAVIAGIISTVAAFFISAGFRDQMPMAEWFYNLEGSLFFLLSALNLVFHLGENLMEISWYMADAKVQALILISGMRVGDTIGGTCWTGWA